MLDSPGPRIVYCNSFLSSSLAGVTRNFSGSESDGTPYAFSSFIEPRLPESLGWVGWIRTGFGSSLPNKTTSKRRSPWLCPAPSVGAGLFYFLMQQGLMTSVRPPGGGRAIHFALHFSGMHDAGNRDFQSIPYGIPA